ncbi:unnamed protein product [Fusarium graminearum]|nr:unnamed protein product [Fusarium graminearum]VTO86050.1 unnamed protein product [Fusarium graminearum]
MRKEVSSIGNQNHQATLDLGGPAEVGELEQKRCGYTDKKAYEQTAEEDQQEDTCTFKETDDAEASSLALFVLLRSFENDNGNGIVQDGFSKDDGVQLGIDLVSVENSQNSNRVGSRESCAD